MSLGPSSLSRLSSYGADAAGILSGIGSHNNGNEEFQSIVDEINKISDQPNVGFSQRSLTIKNNESPLIKIFDILKKANLLPSLNLTRYGLLKENVTLSKFGNSNNCQRHAQFCIQFKLTLNTVDYFRKVAHSKEGVQDFANAMNQLIKHKNCWGDDSTVQMHLFKSSQRTMPRGQVVSSSFQAAGSSSQNRSTEYGGASDPDTAACAQALLLQATGTDNIEVSSLVDKIPTPVRVATQLEGGAQDLRPMPNQPVVSTNISTTRRLERDCQRTELEIKIVESQQNVLKINVASNDGKMTTDQQIQQELLIQNHLDLQCKLLKQQQELENHQSGVEVSSALPSSSADLSVNPINKDSFNKKLSAAINLVDQSFCNDSSVTVEDVFDVIPLRTDVDASTYGKRVYEVDVAQKDAVVFSNSLVQIPGIIGEYLILVDVKGETVLLPMYYLGDQISDGKLIFELDSNLEIGMLTQDPLYPMKISLGDGDKSFVVSKIRKMLDDELVRLSQTDQSLTSEDLERVYILCFFSLRLQSDTVQNQVFEYFKQTLSDNFEQPFSLLPLNQYGQLISLMNIPLIDASVTKGSIEKMCPIYRTSSTIEIVLDEFYCNGSYGGCFTVQSNGSELHRTVPYIDYQGTRCHVLFQKNKISIVRQEIPKEGIRFYGVTGGKKVPGLESLEKTKKNGAKFFLPFLTYDDAMQVILKDMSSKSFEEMFEFDEHHYIWVKSKGEASKKRPVDTGLESSGNVAQKRSAVSLMPSTGPSEMRSMDLDSSQSDQVDDSIDTIYNQIMAMDSINPINKKLKVGDNIHHLERLKICAHTLKNLGQVQYNIDKLPRVVGFEPLVSIIDKLMDKQLLQINWGSTAADLIIELYFKIKPLLMSCSQNDIVKYNLCLIQKLFENKGDTFGVAKELAIFKRDLYRGLNF